MPAAAASGAGVAAVLPPGRGNGAGTPPVDAHPVAPTAASSRTQETATRTIGSRIIGQCGNWGQTPVAPLPGVRPQSLPFLGSDPRSTSRGQHPVFLGTRAK